MASKNIMKGLILLLGCQTAHALKAFRVVGSDVTTTQQNIDSYSRLRSASSENKNTSPTNKVVPREGELYVVKTYLADVLMSIVGKLNEYLNVLSVIESNGKLLEDAEEGSKENHLLQLKQSGHSEDLFMWFVDNYLMIAAQKVKIPDVVKNKFKRFNGVMEDWVKFKLRHHYNTLMEKFRSDNPQDSRRLKIFSSMDELTNTQLKDVLTTCFNQLYATRKNLNDIIYIYEATASFNKETLDCGQPVWAEYLGGDIATV